MSRSIKIYLFLIVVLVVLIAVIDSSQPKPIDWTPTYGITEKKPFGLYIFDREMRGIFKGNDIKPISVTPYEYFLSSYSQDSTMHYGGPKKTFLSIGGGEALDEQSVSALLNFVADGNHAFISAKRIPEWLLDTLKLKQGYDFQYQKDTYNWIANPKLGSKKYKITEGLGNGYFSGIDTLKTQILGYQSGDTARVNFVKVPFKEGSFILHTQPAAFTNFHLLKEDHAAYAEKVMAYIPKNDILWYVKGQDGNKKPESMLRVILGNPQLTWAWYIFLFGLLGFLIFNAKRKQRIVPIIKPLSNTTIDFAKTIGNLYFQEGDHDNIIEKKIIYFLEKVRQDYMIDTTVLDAQFIKKLQLKSGKNPEDIEHLVYLINKSRSDYKAVESDLIEISQAIEKIVS
ncbi:DUF4350 domain-containing protein [Flavobacterium pallidum]|uniref:DUF4350 domain-containing protein n=1 Tax=Flavobacterium pallidum TaxID=2172098 RepID=A0A2S1SKW9_9FLAO|nr:DUF4350 domain-containing protein [Flavobacterium pallidum]AWI27029.1 hypothetical protein HYN49_14570 [Flavobacterium pallidum]